MRTVETSDAFPVSELYRLCDEAEGASIIFKEEDIVEDWGRERFSPAEDAWIVESSAGEVVGYGEVYDGDPGIEVESDGLVHPDHRGHGIGSALLARMEGRAHEIGRRHSPPGPVKLYNFTTAVDVEAARMLRRAGYEVVRHFWHMEGPLEEDVALSMPEGVDIRGFVHGADDRAFYEVMQESFKEHWGNIPEPFEQWSGVFKRSDFDPALWFVAEVDSRIVGGLTSIVYPEAGFVRDMGVLREWRRRGIAESLLRHAFDAYKERGLKRATLNVDSTNETGATRLYERVGMRGARQFDAYMKEIRPD